MASVLESTLRCAASDGGHQRTTSPIVTGTSVVAVKFKGGVVIASDTLGSYGGLARFTEVERVVPFGTSTLVASDGDVSDFQHIKQILRDLELEDKCKADNITYTSKQVWTCMARILYNQRSKMNPLWNNLIVAGFEDGESFLGTTDKIGTSYVADFVATGLGMHMALPLLRRKWRADMKEDEARALVEECMRVLFYRDCRTINRITFATTTKHGTKVDPAVAIQTEWNYAAFEDPSKST
mmetsp:Transcript_23812/g.44213  ORF Transcript_23812/g.44213 Transcript_23812/m.44213 type:complete len:240 (+) Transcript_23812:140-859(+)